MKLAIVGAGKMGGAILTGALQAGVYTAEEIGIYHPQPDRLDELTARFGVQGLDDEQVHRAERILIAVKPQSFDEVAPLIAQRNASYISIMAGVPARVIARRVGSQRVIRAMPNLGARIGRSATAIAHLPEALDEDVATAQRLFEAVGTVFPIPERLFDAFTGLAGSGPAFMAVVAEALADGGVRVGFSRRVAQELARQVIGATAELLAERSPAELKDEVSSAGGTAIAGVRALEQHGARFGVMSAVEDAARRAGELTREDDT